MDAGEGSSGRDDKGSEEGDCDRNHSKDSPNNTIADMSSMSTPERTEPVSPDLEFSTPLSSPVNTQRPNEDDDDFNETQQQLMKSQEEKLVVNNNTTTTPPTTTTETETPVDPSPSPSSSSSLTPDVTPPPVLVDGSGSGVGDDKNVHFSVSSSPSLTLSPETKREPDQVVANSDSVQTANEKSNISGDGGSRKRRSNGSSPTQSIDLTAEGGTGGETKKQEEHESVTVPAGLAGKPGYFGGFASDFNDSDSEDSVLQHTTSSNRRISLTTSGTTFMGFSRRQVLTLFVFGLADFFSAIIISLQAPFYPKEAEDKGATATEYGLVFGVFELVVFLTSPIYGKYLPKYGPKFVFNVGILTTAVATILFGFLDRFDDRTTFIALSFVVRSIEALGDAAFVTASFAIIANEFPDSVATTFASLETFFGLGLIVGPTLGGALYEKGGFTLPFAVMGGFLLVVAFITIFVMPKIAPQSSDSDKNPAGIFDVLKVPGVLLASLNIVTSAITIGFLNATLEPHIRQFNLAPVMTGLVFIINGGLYAVSAPFWGYVVDKAVKPKYTLIFGLLTIFIAFMLIGPAPLLPIDTLLWLTCVGLVIHGMGLGATLVSSFIMALREAINHGFPDSIQTYGLTSALWTSSFALGSFIGPSVAGILFDKFEFRWATIFVLGWIVAVMILVITFIFKTRGTSSTFTPRMRKKSKNLPETTPLLADDPSSSKTSLTIEKEKTEPIRHSHTGGGYGATENGT